MNSDNQPIEDKRKQWEPFIEIPVEMVLAELGANPFQDGDKWKWKIEGIGNIRQNPRSSQSWKNMNTDKKGYGSVSLVMEAKNCQFKEALYFLKEHFNEQIKNFDPNLIEQLRGQQEETEYTPPERMDKYNPQVADYLIKKRGLPSSLVKNLVERGKIYGNRKVFLDKENNTSREYGEVRCVFISPLAGELRGMGDEGFKGCCLGSQTEVSGFMVLRESAVNEKVVALVEAAIDALSYNAMFPGRSAVSTNGSGRFRLQYRLAIDAIETGYAVSVAFDADKPGDLAAQKLVNALFLRKFLSAQLKVSPESVDEWIVSDDINIVVHPSPHHLWWKPKNQGFDGTKQPVLVSKIVEKDEIDERTGRNKKDTVWYDSGEKSEPVVEIQIRNPVHDLLKRGVVKYSVTEKVVRYIHNNFKMIRERPVKSKDWNEDMILLKEDYRLDYEQSAKDGFKFGVPQLPEDYDSLVNSFSKTPKVSKQKNIKLGN